MKKDPKVKEISVVHLRQVALWYLERFGGTRLRVQAALKRRVVRAELAHGSKPEADTWIQEILDELENLGYINDAAFAAARVAKGLRQGKSPRLIAQDLATVGLDPALAQAALADAGVKDRQTQLQAALTYARKRGLGVYRVSRANLVPKKPDTTDLDTTDQDRRDLARMARRGFTFDIAQRALKGEQG